MDKTSMDKTVTGRTIKKLDGFLSNKGLNDWPSMTIVDQGSQNDNPQAVVLSLTINNQLSYLEGHFPGHPVVPGVVQVHWASLLASHFFDIGSAFLKMENVKFQSMVLPEQTVELSLKYHSDKHQVVFHYCLGDNSLSEGKLYFHE